MKHFNLVYKIKYAQIVKSGVVHLPKMAFLLSINNSFETHSKYHNIT